MHCLPSIRFGLLLATAVVSCPLLATADEPAKPPISFSRQVLPILSDHCFLCHGPDEKSREAELRLDVEKEALRTEKPIIQPGKGAESELVRRILSEDPDEMMPPPDAKRPLTAAQKQTLRDWIDQGAKWGKHWAFEPVVRPALPATNNAAWVRNPIDAFVLALEKEKLSPSPEADKTTLLRRVSLDLTGLPPTPEELAAFLADNSPTAYEAAVDRLLQSPRYGERMVWEWLDAARYADTNGYQGDPTRSMYFWRDWAIGAFNQNMPFDQFTIEQLAGDLLPNPTQEQLIATGFHRNHMINGEGGRIAEESRVDYVQDRTETTGTVWLGLTFNCCRCHTHKFDPILQKEYYQLSAYFNSIDESGGNDAGGGLANPVMSLASGEQKEKLAGMQKAEQEANASKQKREEELKTEQTAWIETQQKLITAGDAPKWEPLVPISAASKEAELKVTDDKSILATGKNPEADQYTVVMKVPSGGLVGFRLEALPHESFVNQGPGRADNGNFVLNELTLKAAGQAVKLVSKGADFSQDGWAALGALDGKKESGWAVMPQFGKSHVLTFVPEAPVGKAGEEIELTFELNFSFGRQHTLGHFRLSATSDAAAVDGGVPADIQTLVAKPAAERNDADQKKLLEFQRSKDTAWLAADKAATKAKDEKNNFEKSMPRTMVMRERAEPRKTFILTRGVYTKQETEVSHGVPSVLPPLVEGAPNNRLALAQWLVSNEHPLTPRVTVNRLWQQIFGIGLVKTSEDFGVQGEKPLQPELLEWLASEFRESTVAQPSVALSRERQAWNIKHILRLIVTSNTYRQSSRVPKELVERDPDNRLLARGPRFRLPSWMIRDQALAVSGLLVEKVGGPPVKGYQPTGVWEEATFGGIRYDQEHGDALYRRSVYQFWRRIVGPTMFFDVARRQTCEVKSSRTNTPLQALATLNDVTYVEASRVLAERTLKELPDADSKARLSRMFQRLLVRSPSEAELKVIDAAFIRLRENFDKDPAAAEKLLAVGESPRDKALSVADHAAYTSVANLLLNLDETLCKE